MRGKIRVCSNNTDTAFITTHTNKTPLTQYDANLLKETPEKNTVITASPTFTDSLIMPPLLVYSNPRRIWLECNTEVDDQKATVQA